MEDTAKRGRDGGDVRPEVKRLRTAHLTFLGISEDGGTASADMDVGDFDALRKILQEEEEEEEVAAPLSSPSSTHLARQITSANGAAETPPPTNPVSDSGETSRLDLCYLWEASDEELGLPTSVPPLFYDRGKAEPSHRSDHVVAGKMVTGQVGDISISDGTVGICETGQHDSETRPGGGLPFEIDDVASPWTLELLDSCCPHEYSSPV